ncbi:unnamed protein product, partial [marine sediment metagenome]
MRKPREAQAGISPTTIDLSYFRLSIDGKAMV